ncbi:uncharacterized protein BJ171DRAFT_417980, partial [Polychytrium aggregatum]|uniref:uncharacterized protein n=1 Tax=Polychytrium aggregatum TaxID=110093 RepID=UPI0022FE4079
EDITTIFVVGFPEDMQEREFQNMFTFSSGFEAATLKIPSPGESEESGGRKQIIGFAKFRTRHEAQEARDLLTGRKVDAERGCILKAEMAKKNLHTKRGLSNDLINTYGSPAGPRRLNSHTQKLLNDPLNDAHSYDSPLPIPKDLRDLISPTDIFEFFSAPPEREVPNFLSHRQESYHDSLYPEPLMPGSFANDMLDMPTPSRFASASVPLPTPTSTPTTIPNPRSGLYMPLDSTSYNRNGANNGDSNLPCNTLYVGNLPMNASEDELRKIFSRCMGYKRMSFKLRPNGPMCFVEFEDVSYAALALQELNGQHLTSSMKGGIRLSFSKNPLGVRSAVPSSPMTNSAFPYPPVTTAPAVAASVTAAANATVSQALIDKENRGGLQLIHGH